MCGKSTIRVIANRTFLNRDARECIRVLGNKSDIALTYIGRNDTLTLRTRALVLNAHAHNVVGNAQHG